VASGQLRYGSEVHALFIPFDNNIKLSAHIPSLTLQPGCAGTYRRAGGNNRAGIHA
jgi:hypothetical protein